MSEYRMKTPFTEADARKLSIGDKVILSGKIYTARDAAHKRLVDLLEKGEPLPFTIEGSAVYYVGPSPAKPGFAVGSAGPTTSTRMDPYSPALMKAGMKVMIGKGPRSKSVRDAMKEYGAVYLAATGGAAALIAKSIKSSKLIAWEELGAEAIREYEVEDFPLIVAEDAKGESLYEKGKAEYEIK